MKEKVCVVTGTRAEFGLLLPLIKKLHQDDEVELQLVVTGSHLVAAFGNTQTEIEASGVPIHARVPLDMAGDTKADMAVSTGQAVSRFATYFAQDRPRLVVLLGDRFEIFAAATAAALQGIAIAHIHGGETTEGAVDEFLRHAITKMSYLHFTACEEYRRRVIQLGEDPARVFNVGARGVENIVHLPALTTRELSESLDFDLVDKAYAIVTMHPVTQEFDTSEQQVRALISAMDSIPNMQYIITKANADAGGRVINEIWECEAPRHRNWVVVASLGARRYLSALKCARLMIGNSSSGIIEAPALHVPTINIGQRQAGRMMAESVICCETDAVSITGAIQQGLSDAFRQIAMRTRSPFGDGNTSDRIMAEIRRYLRSGETSIRKSFYDLDVGGGQE